MGAWVSSNRKKLKWRWRRSWHCVGGIRRESSHWLFRPLRTTSSAKGRQPCALSGGDVRAGRGKQLRRTYHDDRSGGAAEVWSEGGDREPHGSALLATYSVARQGHGRISSIELWKEDSTPIGRPRQEVPRPRHAPARSARTVAPVPGRHWFR